MGTLKYGAAGYEVEFDDRLLAHLKTVIVAKLRRDEKFLLTWELDGHRQSIWLHPAVELHFSAVADVFTINRAWVDALMRTANSNEGLRLVPEPKQPQLARA